MKKLLSLTIFTIVIMFFWFYVNADWIKTIKLSPWWNVISTPWTLSDVKYSNGWQGLSFFKLVGGQWQSVAWDASNIKPLVWFLVNNNNKEDVIMGLMYSPQTVMWALLTNNVTKWWNLLWITSTINPLPWGPYVDFTHNWTTNLLNKVNNNYSTYYFENTFNYNVDYPEIWEAYWSYISSNSYSYGWVNNPISDPLSCKINYTTTNPTNQDVMVTINNCTAWETITNWDSYTFTENWTHIFEYNDKYWNHWTLPITVDWIDKVGVECSGVSYSPDTLTNYSVTARLIWCNKELSWAKSHIFSENWEYILIYQDAAWNQNEMHMAVDWIDKTIPNCTRSITPSELTYWPVTVTFNCDKDMVTPLSYTYTWNWDHYLTLRDKAWNSIEFRFSIKNIKSDLTLEENEFEYDNTFWENGNELELISWYLSWENKWWKDLLVISNYYKVHIRNAEPNTDISSIIQNIKVGNYYTCDWTPTWTTDADWNADIILYFPCNSDDTVFWIKGSDSDNKINKKITVSTTLKNSKEWTYIYVDDIDKSNISSKAWLYEIQGWTLHSRRITFWRENLIITKSSTSRSISKWSENILLFSWDLTTTWNEIRISTVRFKFPGMGNNDLNISFYLNDELWESKNIKGSEANFGLGLYKKIHNWEHLSLKLYWTFWPSVPSITGNTHISFSTWNENWNFVNRVDGEGREISNLWDSFLIYDDNTPDIEFNGITPTSWPMSVNNEYQYTFVNTTWVLLFKWTIYAPKWETIISTINFETNNNILNNNTVIKAYINNEFVWSWILNEWNIELNINKEVINYDINQIEIRWDFGCISETTQITPTISIWWITINWATISQEIPSIQSFTTEIRSPYQC